jgi:hypothetical protein
VTFMCEKEGKKHGKKLYLSLWRMVKGCMEIMFLLGVCFT